MCDVAQWQSFGSAFCGRWFDLQSGGHGIHCWWDLIRSKQPSTGSACHTQVFAGFSGHGNSIYNRTVQSFAKGLLLVAYRDFNECEQMINMKMNYCLVGIFAIM